MFWIGLTGGIASGKSTVTKLLQKQRIPVIDADLIAHKVVEPGTAGLKSVVDTFGPGVLQPDGQLDRKKLGTIIFADPAKRLLLESLLHPLVQEDVQKQKEKYLKQGHKMAFYDVPLLFEKDLQDQFDKVVLVTCSLGTQRKRLKDRNQLTDQEIDHRLNSQLAMSDKESRADFILVNEGTVDQLEAELLKLIEKLKNM